MKTLFLMRHAKSSWSEENLSDHERPLNHRGNKAAPTMAQWLVDNDCVPELVISSTALRAKSTAELVVENANISADLLTEKRLYHASPGEITEIASEVNDEFDSLMLVAHNPGMQQLTSMFAGASVHFPTAAIALIDLQIEEWKQFDLASEGTLRELWVPKELPQFE